MYRSEIVLVKWIICVWVEQGFGRTEMLLQGFVVNQSYHDMIHRKPPQIYGCMHKTNITDLFVRLSGSMQTS